MSEVTVKQLADVVGTPIDRLLEQLKEAGVQVAGADAAISDQEKMKLLDYLRTSHGKDGAPAATKKITLKRKSLSELKVGGAGKGKTVSVEVRKKRTYVKRDEEAAEPVQAAPETKLEQLGAELDAQTQAQHEASDARRAEEQSAQQAIDDAKQKAEEDARILAEQEAAALAAEEQASKSAEESARKAEEEAKKAAEAAPAPKEQPAKAQVKDEAKPKPAVAEPAKKEEVKLAEGEKLVNGRVIRPPSEQDKARAAAARNKSKARRGGAAAAATPAAGAAKPAAGAAKPANAGPTRYGRDKIHVASGKGGKRKKKGKAAATAARRPDDIASAKHGFEKPTAPVVREVELGETITVGELAQGLALKASEVVKTLMGMGVMATINQALDQDTATLIVEELGHKVKLVSDAGVENVVQEAAAELDDRETLPRSPVVTIMGHVDHGKTSLLDYIRESGVASGEAGGITQHIGAYHVPTAKGGVTFLDTPGHAAFTAMRARGAEVTDVVILVVAADDGVMPQTVEAVEHAKAAGVPLVVAVNKMDKEAADPDRVKNELSAHDVIPEDWGGENQFVHVSAKTGEGVDALLEAIDLQAEVLELRAPSTGAAAGTVVESSLDKGRGPVATILVQKGTLNKGDLILCGEYYGRVRAMFDESGAQQKTAGPSMPVAVLGLSGTPEAGADMLVMKNERQAREVAETRKAKNHDSRLAVQQAARLENLFSHLKDGEHHSVPVLIKADVRGSAEALRDSLVKMNTDEVSVNVISVGVGGISESDINLAVASGAMVVGFNVRAEGSARRVVEEHGVDMRYYSVIYDVLDDVKSALSGLLSPEVREEIVGLAEVKDVFKSSSMGPVAGCIVAEGLVKRGNPIRVLRENVVVYEGELESLRRFKDDVEEVRMGTECGIAVKNYNDVRPGDKIENYVRTLIERTL